MSQIYLAPDDEITDVVEKLRLSEDRAVTLIVPKGASLLQSLINVRLLKRKADELNKVLGVVTTDQVSKHIADQCGVVVYHNLSEVSSVPESELDKKKTQMVKKDFDGSAAKVSSVKQHGEDVASEPKVSHYQEQKNDHKDSDEDLGGPNPSDLIENDGSVPAVEIAESSSGEPSSSEDIIIGKEETDVDDEEDRPRHVDIRRHLPKWFIASVIALLIVLLVAGGAGAVYFPRVNLVLHVPTQSIKKQITITIDPNATSVSGTTVPGVIRTLNVSDTGSANTTGTKQVGNKATGTITISDTWSSDPFTLNQGSVLTEVESGLTFVTQQTVVDNGAKGVSGGQPVPGTVDVSVVASQPGAQYNLSSGKNFVIQGLTGNEARTIVGSNANSMTGGTTQTVNVVEQADIDQAKSDLKSKLQTSAQSAVSQNEPSDQLLVSQATNVQITYGNSDHAVGDAANTISVSGSAVATALSAHISDLETVITSVFDKGLSSDKSVILPELSQINWAQTSGNGGDWVIQQSVTGQIVTKIDSSTIQTFSLGKKVSSLANNIDSTFNVKSVDIKRNISWWPFMPLLKSHIGVQIEQ